MDETEMTPVGTRHQLEDEARFSVLAGAEHHAFVGPVHASLPMALQAPAGWALEQRIRFRFKHSAPSFPPVVQRCRTGKSPCAARVCGTALTVCLLMPRHPSDGVATCS